MDTRLAMKTVEDVLSERAQRLFLLADQERKGFIVKRDMQRMQSEIPLPPEHLEAVFDTLDVQKNGYLTIEQFLAGFGNFLKSHAKSQLAALSHMSNEDIFSADEDSGVSMQTRDEEEDQLECLLNQLDAIQAFNNMDVLRQLCHRVQKEASPRVQASLETFLKQLIRDIQMKQNEQQKLEQALQRRDQFHNEQLQRIFDELELQQKEDSAKTDHQLLLSKKQLEEQLKQKEEELREAAVNQRQMETELQYLREKEAEARLRNNQLIKRKEELEERLDAELHEVTRLHLLLDERSRNHLTCRQQHMSRGFRLAKAMMLEQQGLLRQLEIVRNMISILNHSNHTSSSETLKTEDSPPPSLKRSSNNRRYSRTCKIHGHLAMKADNLDDYEYDEEYYKVDPNYLTNKRPSDAQSSTSACSDKTLESLCLKDELLLSQNNEYESVCKKTSTPA